MSDDRGRVTSAHWGAARVFTEDGRIVRAEYPLPGESTRDVLIRMLAPPRP